MSDMDNVNEMNSRRRKAQFFLGSTNKRAKTVVLHIDGLDDSVSCVVVVGTYMGIGGACVTPYFL